MWGMKIFSDLQLDEPMLQWFRDSIHPHELLLPKVGATSVLDAPPADPSLLEADIVLGQPAVKPILESTKLKWFQVTSAGITRYDTEEFRSAAKGKGLAMTNSSAVFDEPCAEHVFALMLAQARQLPQALKARHGNGTPEWNALRSRKKMLAGQSVLILGYGAIAEKLVKMLAPFEMRVKALRRAPRGDEMVEIVTHKQLPPALAEADHVVSLLPENAASLKFCDTAFFAGMKSGAVFYNIGRGTTVDQTALFDALNSGHLEAAWLDVTEPEPLPDDHPLWTLENCHITPHTAGGHFDEKRTLITHFLHNLKRFEKSEALVNRIL